MTSTDLFGPASASGAVTSRPADGRTFGPSDTWFKDCSSPTVDDGTEYDSAFFNAMLAQMRAIARGNGATLGGLDVVTQDNSADDLIWRAVQHMYQRGQPSWALDTGTANALAVTLTPAPAEMRAGMRIRVKVAHGNTGGPATLTVNGTPVAISTVGGSNLQKGMLVANQVATFDHDGTNFQLVSVWSEALVFTPTARINLAAVASAPNGVFVSHNLSLASSSSLPPIVGASSFTVPAGTYLFVGSNSIRHSNVHANTQAAQQLRLLSSTAGQLVGTFEATALNSGNDLTCNHNFAGVANVVATDVLSVQSYVAVSAPTDFGGGSANAGTLDIVRIGN